MNTLKEQNGRYYQQCQVVMLATKGKSQFGLIHEANVLHKYDFRNDNPNDLLDNLAVSQHLYILSDVKPELGDWCLEGLSPMAPTELVQVTEEDLERCIENYRYGSCRKIIATTDDELRINSTIRNSKELSMDYGKVLFIIPKPSDSFIKKYIEEYNVGNKITNVLVEYENKWVGKEYVDEQDAYGYDKFKLQLRVDSNNNITIKKTKDTWSKEELDTILLSVMNLGMSHRQDQLNGHSTESGNEVLDKWKQENLY